jgi:hypothetical protein
MFAENMGKRGSKLQELAMRAKRHYSPISSVVYEDGARGRKDLSGLREHQTVRPKALTNPNSGSHLARPRGFEVP